MSAFVGLVESSSRSPFAYPVLLVVHDDLLQRDDGAGPLGLGAMHLSEGTLSELSLERIVAYPRTSYEAVLRPLVLEGKYVR